VSRFIGLWNRKGGVGKTTTAGNMAGVLSQRGRTLLIDADPQSSATSWLTTDSNFSQELADVLRGGDVEATILAIRPDLCLLPSFAIGGELQSWAELELPKAPFAFQDLRDRLEGFDYVVIDLHPGDTQLERAALAICDEILLCTTPEYFGNDGIESALEVLTEVRQRLRGKADASRLVINRVNKSYSAHGVISEHMRSYALQTWEIGQSQAIHDSQMMHQLLWEYDKRNRWTEVYRQIAEAVA